MRAPTSRRSLLTGAALAAGLGAAAALASVAAPVAADTGCHVEYDVVSDWGSGFQANVSLTTGQGLDGWDVSWRFPAGTTVQAAWNVAWEQDGATFTGSDVGWNARVPAGGTMQVFGLIGAGSAEAPMEIAIDGVRCDGTGEPEPTPSDTPTEPEPTPSDTAGPPPGPVRIMPLGDSITGSPGCWRGVLWQLLTDAGHDVDMVGSQSQGCAPTGSDPDHEGHGGYLVTVSVGNGDTRRWLEQSTPDVLLLHFGTNDVWSNLPPAQILAAYTQIVTDLRELNPDATILAAQIIPLAPGPEFGCTDCQQRAVNLNSQIPAWAAGLSTERSPIVVVDQWTGFDPAVDTYDGVHPDEDGNAKIAARWFAALDQVLP
jgi:hypothetical protein